MDEESRYFLHRFARNWEYDFESDAYEEDEQVKEPSNFRVYYRCDVCDPNAKGDGYEDFQDLLNHCFIDHDELINDEKGMRNKSHACWFMRTPRPHSKWFQCMLCPFASEEESDMKKHCKMQHEGKWKKYLEKGVYDMTNEDLACEKSYISERTKIEKTFRAEATKVRMAVDRIAFVCKRHLQPLELPTFQTWLDHHRVAHKDVMIFNKNRMAVCMHVFLKEAVRLSGPERRVNREANAS